MTTRPYPGLEDALTVGRTWREVGDELGVSEHGARAAARRRGLRRKQQGDYRKIEIEAGEMKPVEAVPYLLGIVQSLLEIETMEQHPTDEWARFTGMEKRMIRALYDANGKPMHRLVLMNVLYFDRSEDERPETKIIDVKIHHIRQKIRGKARINTIWGEGYVLEKIDGTPA